MGYKLLCTDIDGTLLNSRGEVSRRSREAIRAAFAAGRLVTLCTGRTPRIARPFAALLPQRVPLICTNGTALVDSRSFALLEEHPVSPETVAQFLSRFAAREATLVLWHGDEIWAAGKEEDIRAYEKRRGCRAAPLADFQGCASKLLLLGSAETVERCRQELLETPLPDTETFTSDPFTLEIIRAGCHKGFGLLRCAARLGIDPRDVIAVGDEHNDIPMLRAAGLGVAMGNCAPGVAQHAQLTAPTNDEDGLAWVIEEYLLS